MSKNKVIILSIVHQGLTVSETARRHGVSRAHIYRLLTRYRQHGLPGIERRKPIAMTNPNKTSERITERIITLRKTLATQGLDDGPISIQSYLEREGITPPSTSTIRRILTTAGLIIPEPKKRPKSSLVRFEAHQPNETWQSDVTYWFLSNGQRAEILDWLDDHSRLLLSITCHNTVTGDIVVQEFQANTEHYGLPYSTLTDNGVVFTARFQGGTNKFEYLLAHHGIQQKNGSPGHPQTQGKIERFHRTLKKWLREQPRAGTLGELQGQLDSFQKIYNEIRPHRAHHRKTPHTVYHQGVKAEPGQKTNHHSWRIRHDHVDKDGKISLRRAGKMHHLGTGAQHRGTPVIILIDETTVTVTNKHTGEVLSQHTITPAKTYWRNQLRAPGRWPN